MKTLIWLLGLSLLILGGLPTLISTHLGTEFLAYTVEKWMGGSLHIKELSIGWFDMQKMEGFDYENPSYHLKINRLTSHNSLFEILFKGGDLGKTLIYSPELTVKGSSSQNAHFPLLPYAGDVYIENGSLITPHGKVTHLNLEVGIPINRSLVAIKASLQTHYENLSGSLDLKGTFYPNLQENSSFQAEIKDFPLEPLDQMISLITPEYTGVILTALGKSLNLHVNASYTKNHLGMAFDLRTPLMDGQFDLSYADGAIALAKKSTLHWLVQKELYPYFNLPFQDEVALEVNFDSLSLPFDLKTLNWKGLEARGSVVSKPFTLLFDTKNLSEALSLTLTSIPLNGNLILKDLIHPVDLEFHAKKFPLSVLNGSGEIVPLLGRFGDFDLSLHQELLHFQADSEFLHISPLSIEWKQERFHLQAPSLITLKNYSGHLTELSGSFLNFKGALNSLEGREGKIETLNFFFRAPKLKVEGTDGVGSFSGSFNFKDSQGAFSLNRLSTYNLGTLLGYERDLPSLIGPTLSGKITQKGNLFDLNLNASGLTVQGALYHEKGTLFKGGPLNVVWTLSDQSYHALARMLKKPTHQFIEIKKPSDLKLQVDSFDAHTFQGNIDLKDLYLSPDYHLQNLKGSLSQTDTTDFNLSCILRSGTQTGHIKLKGNIDDKTELQGEILNLPTIFLDALPLKTRLSQIFGEKLSVNMNCSLEKDEGILNVTIDATNFKTDVLGSLKKGVFYLNRSIDVGMRITPELGKWILGDVGIDVVGAKNPLLIHIDERGLAIPYRSFQMKTMTIPNASIDLGQILIRSSGSAADVNKIFKLQKNGDEPLHLYFAPLVLHINQGIVNIERTEMLYDHRFDLCTWGEINLVKEYVNLKLGFTAEALYQGFGLKMPSSYVLAVSLKGPYDNVKIDTQGATAKIAGIIAQKAGAAVGGVWGGVLGIAGGITDDQSKIPPPKHPFPWEKQLNFLEKPTPPQKSKKARQLLKNLRH